MIIREDMQQFTMIGQHDHAVLSGEIADRLVDGLFGGDAAQVRYAVRQHDRAWIRLDRTPVWNDREHRPFSFFDYPLPPKLVLYRLGVDEVEEADAYAALLCSLHYTSFIDIRSSDDPDCVEFTSLERERQDRIRSAIGDPDEKRVSQHLKLLQLCDNLSLYVGMNEPGAEKRSEHPWFRNGVGKLADGKMREASWIDNETIRITPWLIESDFTASLPLKRVSKDAVQRLGIQRAYAEAKQEVQTVTFTCR
ncbi:DUF3891 family protein [Paenibacillus humicola]|uniref:DUF3891 family protein n=1 Tax=Paenibacillus humicola TaxID=3110540 RepID=UPI00237A49B7|nr:DUF3891 family protein [Paenibacillus humicola]